MPRLHFFSMNLFISACISPIWCFTFDPLLHVDQMIGTGGDGHVFGGATLPYGMAKAVADSDSPDNQGGFVPALNGVVTGFSSMHDSGTGGSPSLGNFALFPHPACPDDILDRCTFPKRARKLGYQNSSVLYSPGYFGITLNNRVKAEMTVSQHASLFRFTFPKNESTGASNSPLILLDLTDLSDSRQDNGTIKVDSTTGRMVGNARFVPSFAQGTYKSYFCADFVGNSIRDTGIYVNTKASTDVRELTISRSINGYPLPGGAFIRFTSSDPVLVRVGLSFISSEQACSNAENELSNFDFAGTKINAENAWRKKLSPIRVSSLGVPKSLLTNFYSGIYRTMVNPQDYTGENQLWKSSEPYFDSFYCIWDLFRSQLPFLTVLDPRQVTRMVRSLLDTYVHDGWLPDCRMTFSRGYTQGGSNADIVLADAYLKNLTEGINWEVGYQAVVKDGEIEPFDWCCQGRGGLDSWKALGYIPIQDFDYKGFGTMTRSVSRTLEYSYNDFAIATLAYAMGGKNADVEKYLGRSANWLNLWKSDQPSFINGSIDTGFTGFFQPRYLNKTWAYQDPLKCSHIDYNNSICSLQASGPETFESSIWEYGFFVPHDQATLIHTLGGPSQFVRRLDYLHERNITDIGNEPAFLTVFQYHYAGRPGLSARRAHYYIPSFFRPTVDGLPGNDDSGAMGSFVAFSMMGLFPNPGQNVYLIIPPFFESVAVTSPLTGKTARVRITNFDPSYKDIFIQNATLNGQDYTKNWLTHDFFTEGWELVLTVGRNESLWGTQVADLPPSVGPYLDLPSPGRFLADDSLYGGPWTESSSFDNSRNIDLWATSEADKDLQQKIGRFETAN